METGIEDFRASMKAELDALRASMKADLERGLREQLVTFLGINAVMLGLVVSFTQLLD